VNQLLAETSVSLQTNFGGVDWAIVVVYLLVSVVVGVYANKYISQLSDFLVAGRTIRIYLGIATMTGTEIGLITLMYAAGDGFNKGFASFHIGIVWGVGTIFLGLTGFVVYRLRQLGVMTIPEYYGMRYNVPVRWLGGLILALAGILNMGLFLRAGADFITGVTGLNSHGWLTAIMTALMALVLLYTILGGMVSIIITDLVQFIVLSTGMIMVTYFAVDYIGWTSVFQMSAQAKGIEGLNPFVENSGYGVMYIISMLLLVVSCGMSWQSVTMRTFATRNPKVAKNLYVWSAITFCARFVIPAFWGICAFIFLQLPENADLYKLFAKTPDAPAGMYKPIQAMPVMIGHVVPSVLLGLVVAAMVAAFMSTHDSYLLSWAGVLTQDVVAPLKPDMSDKSRIRLTRLFIFLIGIFLLYWGLWYPAPASLWDYMATTGTIYFSGASALLVCGLYWRRASNAGAMASLLAGLIALAPIFKKWLPVDVDNPIYKFANEEHVCRVFAFIASWLAMIVFSLLLPNRTTKAFEMTPQAGEVRS